MNYVVDHYSMSARRHAIRPDEAEYLTRNLPRLDTSSCCESPHQLRGQEEIRDTASSTTFNASSAPEEYHFRSSSWETNRSSALSDQDNVAPTAHLHDGQRQWPNPDGMTWEKLATFSGDLLPKHLDNKRKFVAMSGAEDVIDPSPPAMDIVHPSEIGRKQGKHREQDFDAAGTVLTQCDDGSYCCGVDSTDCCDKGEGTKINKSNGQLLVDGQITTSIAAASTTASTNSPSATHATSSTSSSSPSTVTTGGVTTFPSRSSANTTSSSSSLSSGAKAGIAIGVIAGLALIAGLLYLLFRERRKRRALQSANQAAQYAPTSWQSEMHTTDQFPLQEMSAYDRQDAKLHFRGELPDGQGKPQELHT
ncbi:MAG: hypothetical protein L6R39_002554 [Caloplaca ligustica]|nr:MAG: hypothetical protein L6R39_002554 [Caloplaca ligustica]